VFINSKVAAGLVDKAGSATIRRPKTGPNYRKARRARVEVRVRPTTRSLFAIVVDDKVVGHRGQDGAVSADASLCAEDQESVRVLFEVDSLNLTETDSMVKIW